MYDGECALCSSQARFVGRHDRHSRFRFVTLQSEEGKELLRAAGLPGEESDTLLYAADGRLMVRSTAAIGIVKEMGWPWRLLGILQFVPVSLRDSLYRIVARNRYRWGGRGDRAAAG